MIASCAGAIEIVTDFESLRSARKESCACTTAVETPAVDGVPEIAPDIESSINPAGRSPDRTDHVTVPTAPLTLGEN